MSTLHNSHRRRFLAITLLTLVVAQFAAPAFGGIEVDIRGVGEDIRANILAYLSFERYKPPTISAGPRGATAGAQRARWAAMRPFGYYEPRSSPRCNAREAAASRTTAS